MKLKLALIIPILLASCYIEDVPEQPPHVSAVTAEKALPKDDIPPLLQIAGWLAQYGMEVVEVDESPTWEASYPESGTQSQWFIWEARTMVAAVPYSDPTGLVTALRVLTIGAHQDSFKVRVAAVDSLGNVSSFSPWGSFTGAEGPQVR